MTVSGFKRGLDKFMNRPINAAVLKKNLRFIGTEQVTRENSKWPIAFKFGLQASWKHVAIVGNRILGLDPAKYF